MRILSGVLLSGAVLTMGACRKGDAETADGEERNNPGTWIPGLTIASDGSFKAVTGSNYRKDYERRFKDT